MRDLKKYYKRRDIRISKNIILFCNLYHLKSHYYMELGIRIKTWVIFLTIKNRW